MQIIVIYSDVRYDYFVTVTQSPWPTIVKNIISVIAIWQRTSFQLWKMFWRRNDIFVMGVWPPFYLYGTWSFLEELEKGNFGEMGLGLHPLPTTAQTTRVTLIPNNLTASYSWSRYHEPCTTASCLWSCWSLWHWHADEVSRILFPCCMLPSEFGKRTEASKLFGLVNQLWPIEM